MPRVWESYSLYGDGNETVTTRLYLDRTDDRGCDCRYFGGNSIAGLSGLCDSFEDVGSDCGHCGLQDLCRGILVLAHGVSGGHDRCGLFDHRDEVRRGHFYRRKRRNYRHVASYRREPGVHSDADAEGLIDRHYRLGWYVLRLLG